MNRTILVSVLLALATPALSWTIWSPAGPARQPALCGAISPTASRVMLVVSRQDNRFVLRRSTDLGITWDVLSDSLAFRPDAIVFAPSGDSITYAAAGRIYKSTDQGETWFRLATPEHTWCSNLAVVRSEPNEVWCAGTVRTEGGDRAAFGRSTDHGATWSFTLCDTNRSFAYSVAGHPTDTALVYCGGWTDGQPVLYRSRDRGRTWTASRLPPLSKTAGGIMSAEPREEPTGGRLHSLYIHPTSPDTIVAAVTWRGLYFTPNGGRAWARVGTMTGIRSLVGPPETPDAVYAGSDRAIWRSRTAGERWTEFDVHNGPVGVLLAPGNADIAWAVTAGGVLQTINGWSWDPVAVFPVGRVTALSRQIGQPQALYAAVEEDGVFRLDLASWEWYDCAGFPGDDSIAGLAGMHPGAVWALTRAKPACIWRSTDQGASWTPADSWLDTGGAIAVSPVDSLLVGAVGTRTDERAGSQLALALSTDRGITWNRTLLGRELEGRALAMHPTSSGEMLVAGDSAGTPVMFRTTDTGVNWQRVGAGLAGTVNCIFYNHAIPRVYCGTSDGFYYSTNGGADWRHDGLVEVRSIAAGRLNVLAATRSGVFLNQGQGWVEYSSGLTDLDSYAVSMVYDYYGIFAGTGSAGVFIGLYPVDINEPTRPASPSALRFPTILRGVLNLPAAGMANDQFSMTMLDATGRKVMVLQPGENDVRHQSDFGQGLLRFTLVR